MAVADKCSRRYLLKAIAATVATGSLCSGLSGWSYARSARGLFSVQSADEVKTQEGAIDFESSNTKLVEGFRWAKSQALAYARTDGTIGPWYEASLPGRDAFCMRDVSHMSTGAQFLGLGLRTVNMLRRFAANISASKKWCSWWEITRDNRPAPVDYNNDHDFWYDLPANFDVLDACYRQWLWTRNSEYLDGVFINFYQHTVSDYVKAWDRNGDGLLEHLPSYGHVGIATYDEDLQNQVLVGSDLIAAQYAAYRDYAAIARTRNQLKTATDLEEKADSLKSLYNGKWWDAKRNRYFGAIGEDGKFHADLKEGDGRGAIEFPLYYGLVAAGAKMNASLDILEQRLKSDLDQSNAAIGGVEGRSYMPDIFYRYGRSQAGYLALTAMMDPNLKRREYPEVSYTAIGNLGTGLMGIRPLAAEQTVETFPQLTEDTGWATLHHAPVGRNVISVKHIKNNETALINEQGPGLTWRVAFPDQFRALTRNGKQIQSNRGLRIAEAAETYSTLQVDPGETCVIQAAN